MNIINLDEIRLAKKVVKEYPEAIKKLDIIYQMLYNSAEFMDIAKILDQVEESKYMMELTLEVYSAILKNAKENANE